MPIFFNGEKHKLLLGCIPTPHSHKRSLGFFAHLSREYLPLSGPLFQLSSNLKKGLKINCSSI